jgi:arylformamidase
VRFGAVLKEAQIPVTLYAGKDTDHSKINNDLGLAGDPATAELEKFVTTILKPAN